MLQPPEKHQHMTSPSAILSDPANDPKRRVHCWSCSCLEAKKCPGRRWKEVHGSLEKMPKGPV